MNDRPPDEQDTRSPLRRLLKRRWRPIAVLGATSLVGGLLEAAFLIVVTRAGLAITSGDSRVELVGSRSITMWQAVAVALVIAVLRTTAAIVGVWLSARLTAAVTAEVRTDLASAFLRASWAAQHGDRVGRLQELLTTFVQQGTGLVKSLTSAVTAAFNLLAMIVVAVAVDPAASLIVVAASVVIGVVLRPLRRRVRGQAKRTAATGMSFATSLGEISQLGMEMHIFGVQEQTEAHVAGLISANENTQRRLRLLQGLVPVVYVGVAYAAIVVALGAISSLDRLELTGVGAVMLIMLRSLTYGQALQSSSTQVSGGLPFLDELDAEIDRYRSATGPEGTAPLRGDDVELVLDSVEFEYEPGTPVLRGISLTIAPREVLGIVGPSGSGKSTLVQLILGLRPPTSGTITANGVATGEIRRDDWHRAVTFVPQQARLISGTVADNIRFMRTGVMMDDIERAARLAHIHDDIVSWDGGYDRHVGESGGQLSGGQQQRLIIARALIERPKILVLDEPTSALDAQSEELIRGTIDDLRRSMAIIIIAHRLSTLDSCDRILVVRNGTIEAAGRPTDLEQTSTFFRRARELSGLGAGAGRREDR